MATAGVDVRLDLDDNGEILVRGPNVSAGYWRNPSADEEAFTDDGYFRTGDVGEWSPDGYLSIVGRIKELIISGSCNVYPREAEGVPGRHPGVAEVAIVGVPSAEWGEEIAAIVVAADAQRPPTLEGAGGLLRGAPGRLQEAEASRAKDSLPRSAMGKIARTQLSDAL